MSYRNSVLPERSYFYSKLSPGKILSCSSDVHAVSRKLLLWRPYGSRCYVKVCVDLTLCCERQDDTLRQGLDKYTYICFSNAMFKERGKRSVVNDGV